MEGDDVLFYAMGDQLSKKALLHECLKMFHEFHYQKKELNDAIDCDCNACAGIDKVTLKFVVYYETIYTSQIPGGFLQSDKKGNRETSHLAENSLFIIW